MTATQPLLTSLAVLALLAGCGHSQVPANNERKTQMQGIQVTASPVRAAVLPGESLVVRSTVQNRGDSPVTAPDEQSDSPMSYRLESDGAPTPLSYAISAENYHTQTRIGLAPRTAIELPESLPPGGVQIRNEDLALYHDQPIAPGKYRLTAAWTQGMHQSVSGFTRVVVSTPRIEAWASEICRRTEELRSVFAHRREDGELVLYERASRSNRPQYGVFRPRVRLDKATHVSSIAPAVVLEDSGYGNWLAWIAGGSLRVVGVLADELNAQPPAQPLGIAKPRLVGPGFHTGPGQAVFFVAGDSPAGTVLELWSASAAEIKRLWHAPLGRAPLGAIRILAQKRDGGHRFVAVFEENSGSTTRLFRRDYNQRGPLGEPRLLAEFKQPLLAWSLEPTDYPAPAQLAIAQRGAEPESVQARILDLEGAGPGAPVNLPRLSTPADLWSVLSFDQRLFVAARGGGKVLSAEAGASDWKEIGAAGEGTAWLHLFSPHSIKLWAEWCAPGTGPQRTQILQTRDAID